MDAGKSWLLLCWELLAPFARFSQFVSLVCPNVSGILVSLLRSGSIIETSRRRIPQNIPTAAGLALVYHSLVWRWSKFSFCFHVGHGIRIDPGREEVQTHFDHMIVDS